MTCINRNSNHKHHIIKGNIHNNETHITNESTSNDKDNGTTSNKLLYYNIFLKYIIIFIVLYSIVINYHILLIIIRYILLILLYHILALAEPTGWRWIYIYIYLFYYIIIYLLLLLLYIILVYYILLKHIFDITLY